MNRDMQTKRAFDRAKALHKKRLALAIYGRDYYTHFNQYAKGKIHCGCPLCSTKTNVKVEKLGYPTKIYSLWQEWLLTWFN